MEGRLAVEVQPAHLRRPAGPRVHRAAPRRNRDRHERARIARQLLRRRHAVGHRALVRGELRRLRDERHAQRRLRLRMAPVRRPARGRRVRVQHLQEVRLGVRARPLRPRLGGPQAHRARSLPAREHGLPARPGQQVRALHGRRQEQRGRLQVRLRPQLLQVQLEQPQDPRGRAGSTSRAGSPRADAGSRRPATPRRSRRPRARAAGSGSRRPSSTTRRPSCAPGSAPTTTRTSRPTGPRTSRSPRTARCSSRSRTTRAPACSTRTARSAACARTTTTRRRSTFTWRDYAAGGPTSAGRRRLLEPRQPRDRQGRQPLGGHRHLLEPPQPAERVPVPRQQRDVHGPDPRARTRASPSASPTAPSRARSRARTSRPTRTRCSSTSSTRAS